MLHFDLNDLSLFLTIANQRNLTKGAENFGLSAPSASSRIKKLEDAFQTALLKRSTKGVETTEAGDLVYESARKIMWELDALKSSIKPYVRKTAGYIKVHANYGAALDFLPKEIGNFLQFYPYVKFELVQQPSPRVVDSVLSGEADIGVCAYDGMKKGVMSFPYKEDELVVIAPLGHVLSKYKQVCFDETLHFPFVALATGSAMQRFVQDNAQKIGKRLNIKVQVDNPEILIDLVSSGIGIGIILKKSLEKADCSKLTLIKLKDDWAKRHLKVFIAEKVLKENPELVAFKDFLLQAAPRTQ